MEMEWYAARACLRHLRQRHPDWSYKRLAEEVGYSYNWVRKWCRRFDEAKPDDPTLFCSHSRRRKKPPGKIAQTVVDKILAIRDEPPRGLHRTPGPVAIKYYLGLDEELQQGEAHIPRSTSTIWAILDANGRITRPGQRVHQAEPRPTPYQVWQIDFKDVTTVRLKENDKKMHLVETLNVVDCGTSVLVDNQDRADFNAETVIDGFVTTFKQWGLPRQITFDRDSRFVGSARMDDFPAPFVRFLLCLGVEPNICPPHRPDKNGFVERLNRTYKEEAIQIYQPETSLQVAEMNQNFRHHYNDERPNQAPTCQNQPPRHAFPFLPTLPPLPDTVDPDRWLNHYDGRLFKRRVNANGAVQLDKDHYFIRSDLHKQWVWLQIDAPNRQLHVLLDGKIIKTMPIKGLLDQPLPFNEYLKLIKQQAISQWRLYLQSARRYVQLIG